MQTPSHNEIIDWKINGPNWTFELRASSTSDPMELFTQCLEQIWAEIDSWKIDRPQEQSSGVLTTTDNQYPSLSVLLTLENSKMSSKQDHLVVSTSLALANAGLHSEASRLERKWNLIPEEERLKTLLHILEETSSD